MKQLFALLLILPFSVLGQTKQIANSELTPGSGMFFAATMTTTDVTITVQGPSDRYIAFGFGSGMSSGDAFIYSNSAGTDAARDHHMVGYTTPSIDAQQNWNVTSNTVNSGVRTIVASRPLNTGDANDVQFNFSDPSVLLFWAKGFGASTTISNHGGGNRANGITRNWVLVDQTPPTIASFNPTDNSNVTNLSANLVATFSENIAFGTGSISLFDGNNNLIQSVASGNPAVSISGTNLTFNPTADLILNQSYYLHIDPTAITDIAGNAFAGFNDNTTWNFTTNDVTPPTISGAFSPADNAVAVALTANLVATFSENVQSGSGAIQLFEGAGNLVESFVLPNPNVTITGNTVTINPTADLVINSNYYVQIAAGAITDISNNPFAGISNTTTWNWNTNDIVAPTLVGGFTPADNFTGVSTSTNFVMTFSENIQAGTGSVSIFLGNGTLFHAIDVANSTELSINGATATIDLVTDLNADESYYILVDATAFDDLSGNSFAGISSITDWNFNTNTSIGPDLLINPFTPADNASNVSLSPNFSVNFNENIVIEPTGTASLFLSNGTLVETLNGSSLTASGATLNITWSANLLETTDYYVTLSSNLVRDNIGNFFVGFSDDLTWNFTTGDFTAPIVIGSYSPADNQINVPLTTSLSVSFSENILLGTGSITILDLTNGTIAGTYSSVSNPNAITISGTTLTITPISPLNYTTNYAVQIEPTAITDASSNANLFAGIADTSTWNFASITNLGQYELSFLDYSWNGSEFVLKNNQSGLVCMDQTGRIVRSTEGSELKLDAVVPGMYTIRLTKTNQTVRVYVP